MWGFGLAMLALAQSAPADGSEIVVTGDRLPDNAIHEFVRDIAEETETGQLARWAGAVCPFVTGLRTEHDDYIARTVSSLAEAVGAEAGGPDCDPNFVAIVTDDPNGLILELRERRAFLFASLNPAARVRLSEGSAPVRRWNVVATRGSDGRYAQRQIFGSGGVGPAVGLGNPDTEYLYGVEPSRIVRSTRIDLATSFIVIDASNVEGLTLQQLSGFVAMMALAQLETDEPIRPARSILNLFHAEAGRPEDLSDWDIAYLRALYASDNRRSASAQRGQMTRMMREELAVQEDE